MPSKESMRTVLAFSLSACLLMACGAEEEEFRFGAAEMQNAVTGEWTGTLTVGGQPTTHSLHLERAEPSARPMCENRTFAHPQCIDMTTMGLVGTLTTADKAYTDAAVSGSFDVYGFELSGGDLLFDAADLHFATSFSAGQADRRRSRC